MSYLYDNFVTVREKSRSHTDMSKLGWFMERAFQEFHLFTWNYSDHDLACLSAFPDSNHFYSSKWIKHESFESVLYLSTCNRVELYVETKDHPMAIDYSELISLFSDSILQKGMTKHTPVYKRGLDAVRHLFQVTSGLKSMALGETQITGQVKRDFAQSNEMGYISPFFHNLMQKVFESQKKIRTQTKIGKNPVSLLSLLEKEMNAQNPVLVENFKTAALGGTGDMCQKSLRYLINKGVRKFIVIRNSVEAPMPPEFESIVEKNRDQHGFEMRFIEWRDLAAWSEALNCEIFITSTYAEKPLLDEEKIDNLIERKFLVEGAFVVDLGIPPNVELKNVERESYENKVIINLNGLMKQSKINKSLRGMHYREAIPIIEKSIHVFWMDYLYSRNPQLVNSVLSQVEEESRNEWSNLINGPLKSISEKQRRIIIDYMKKQERRALRTHKELFVDMMTHGEDALAVS